jgi:hypothetical protein
VTCREIRRYFANVEPNRRDLTPAVPSDGDAALDRLGLVSDPDLAHAAFAELLAELEAAGEDAIGRKGRPVRLRGVGWTGIGSAFEDAGGPVVGLEQALHAPAEGIVAAAGPVQE